MGFHALNILHYFYRVLIAFKKHIEVQFPLLVAEKFILACSGGVDSVALVHLCHASELDFAIAHCNFGLRGTHSDGDEEFVRVLANNLNKPFLVTHFDTMDYVNKNKVSVQMAARELRYAWFAEIMKEKGIGTLVTAHHADDNLETFFINLSRGTGINGLAGIPAQTDSIARPLLKFTRNEILSYVKAQELQWREDSSNAETKYIRNKIRHKIVPLLKELHPTFLKNFRVTQEFLHHTAELTENYAHQLRTELFENKGGISRIKVARLESLHPLKAHLYAIFKKYGFKEWNDVAHLLSAMSGKEVRSRTHRLVKDRDYLLLSEMLAENDDSYQIRENEIKIDRPIPLTIENVVEMKQRGATILYVDKETLKYPLTVRKWQKGDYFYPFGMNGKKKISKFFKDEKIDVISKNDQWLLCSEDKIVWVIGRRADDRFKVTGGTKRILKFELNTK